MGIVVRSTFKKVLDTFKHPGFYAVDTETTGLNAYLGDRLFSIILANKDESFYFNFQAYPGLSEDWVLPREWIAEFQGVFDVKETTWFLHNAKFDLSILAMDGLEIHGHIHDTEVVARLLYNDYLEYSLDACAARIGEKKSDAVEEYIAKHKLFTERLIPGKKKRVKDKHYNLVPFNIISEYGLQDGRVTHKLGSHQLEELHKLSHSTPKEEPQLETVYRNEQRLVKTCFNMERLGIKIDRGYCESAFDFETKQANLAVRQFEDLAGMKFVDSGKMLAEAFTKMGEDYPRTAKGNPSFTDDVLSNFETPLAKFVQSYRAASKRANTYYRNFLDLADTNDLIHANMRQGGTVTGRFSYSEPNLQNLTKPDEDAPEEANEKEFEIRCAFVPRSEEYCFVMIDYDQMEYRMMLDYARQKDVIEAVLGGLDVHKATAEMMGVTRFQAKTLNFMLLYGGGVAKLAKALNISEEEAQELKALYFRRLPNVRAFSKAVIEKVTREGQIYNWAGFRYRFPDSERAYVAPNHLIQGGCAQVVRFAMNEINSLLVNKKSKMLVTVHDEIVVEMHKDELNLVADVKKIMETSYKHRQLPLTVGVSHSWKSWGHKIKGFPTKEN